MAKGSAVNRSGQVTPQESQLILVLSEDLFILPHIEDVARELGYDLRVVEKPEALGVRGFLTERSVPLTEPIRGADALFMRALSEMRPALLLIDTQADGLPWARWIRILKTSAATRRLPIVAFGPHVEKEDLRRSEDMGADAVVTRGQLHAKLPKIIQRWARKPAHAALRRACEGTLSPEARRGVELINAGEYYQAHEWLEQAWMEACEHEGSLYRALLQVSVTYLHIQRNNYAGAVKMLLRLRQWLDPLPAQCRGVDTASLATRLDQLREALDAVGAQRLSELDPSILQPIPMVDPETRD